MDKVCDEYVALRWCFVAVKTKVGQKEGVDPKPGMRKVNSKLPAAATFDGNVQAMGFRFKTEKLTVPMRLSAFNDGDLRNVVYLLTDGPRRIRSIPEEYVVRQLAGDELHRNLTEPLPLRVIGGTAADIPQWRRDSLKQERDPAPHNGHAKEMFASDLLAVREGRLSHPHEEAEKMLLRVGEHFALRGPEVDLLNSEALRHERDKAVASAVDDIKKMSLTVVDGDFPREVLGGQNLQFAEYKMPSRRNTPLNYDTKLHGPSERPQGTRYIGALSFDSPTRGIKVPLRHFAIVASAALALALLSRSLLRGWHARLNPRPHACSPAISTPDGRFGKTCSAIPDAASEPRPALDRDTRSLETCGEGDRHSAVP
jgi:hypothetical protein